MDCRAPTPNNARAPPVGAPEGGRTVGDHRGGRVRGQRAWPRRLRLVTVLLAAVMMPGLVAVPAGAGLLPPLLPPPSPPLKVIVQQLDPNDPLPRSEEHKSELQSLMRISYAVFCLKKKKQ